AFLALAVAVYQAEPDVSGQHAHPAPARATLHHRERLAPGGPQGLKIFSLAGGLLVADRQDQTISGSDCMLLHCGHRFDGIAVCGRSAAEGNFPVWPSATQRLRVFVAGSFPVAQFTAGHKPFVAFGNVPIAGMCL
ncbi:MAG: hypothetical protein Q7T78_13590, partial [Rhodoferax sp.]|nr:hypothetical protein [Rhodoferax sp.]